MINFDHYLESPEDLIQENLLDDALKAGADIDTGKIKDTWKDSDASITDKARSLNDEGLKKAGKEIDALDKVFRKNQVNTASIITRAKNSVLQFPIYVTQSIRVDEAHIIAKMFERVYTTLVQTVLSQNQTLEEGEEKNLAFLKHFHTNLREAADVLVNKYYEPIDNIDQMMCESIFYSSQISKNCRLEFSVVPTTDENLIMENIRLLNEPLKGFSYLREETKKDDKERTEKKTNKETTRLTSVSEGELEGMAKDRADMTIEELELLNRTHAEMRKLAEEEWPDDPVQRAKARESYLNDKKNVTEKLQNSLDQLKQDIKDGEIEGYSYDGARYYRRDVQKELGGENIDSPKRPEGPEKAKEIEKGVDAPELLKDGDIKKINGMAPYSIKATFHVVPRNGTGLAREIKYVIGIKSVLHIIRPKDLSEDLRDLVTGNIKSLRKVRYQTGEISRMEYLFNTKGLKADAAKHINYDKRWLNTLKRLGEYEQMYGTLLKKPVQAITGGHVPIPNGTMILSQPDVTKLTNETGIDLSIVSNAKRLAKTLFLIGIVIVDSTAGTMRVLFPDSDVDWDVQSMKAIDAELSKTDNSQIMKELNRMVNR